MQNKCKRKTYNMCINNLGHKDPKLFVDNKSDHITVKLSCPDIIASEVHDHAAKGILKNYRH